jgi:hypothetical protein
VSKYQLAQFNVAVMKFPLDAPEMAEFVAALAPINALAERAPGFVWRLQGDGGDSTAFRPIGEHVLVNMSVWEDVASLDAYTYRSGHVEIVRRRRDWFELMKEMSFVLWWVERGRIPTVQEALEKLERARREGPTPEAFTFRNAFAPPDAELPGAPIALGGARPAEGH